MGAVKAGQKNERQTKYRLSVCYELGVFFLNKSTFTTTTMETIQWFVFMLAGTVAMPIVIGAIYDMSLTEISGLMQRCLFVIGLASLLQALFGHRLPIMEVQQGYGLVSFP